jgi:DNA primase
MNPSDEIKSRLDIVDVIREYIQLKPAGVNFSARCPFHNEKSASFMVSPDKQIWHCFGCGKGGDVFSFVMEIEGLSFVEVLRELAPKAGVELRAENSKETSQRNRLLDVMAEATSYYHKILIEHPLAASARAYLEKRGLSDGTIEEWKIGFSLDDWEDLVQHLKARGFKDEEIFLAGLSSKKEGSNRHYNRFRGRIMFPINDINGNPVAFTARVSPEKEATEKMGKYVNSPQTAIYDKGRILFGLDKAKQAIKQAGLVVLVEGQMDVITAHQHGYKNVVASSGTALTEGQVVILKRFTDNFALAFDSDNAGQMAIERGESMINENAYKTVSGQDRFGRVKTYLEPSFTGAINLKVIEIPNGKDPDDCIRTDHLVWEQAVKQAKPIMQFYFDKNIKKFDITQIEGKREATKVLLGAIGKLGNKIEQEAWVRKLAEVMHVSENLLFEALPRKKIAEAKEVSKAPAAAPKAVNSKSGAISELLLALTLRFPEHFSFLLNHLELAWLEVGEPRELYKNLVIYYNQHNDQDPLETSNVWGEIQIAEENNIAGTARNFSYQGLRDWLATFDDSNNTTDSQAAFLDRLTLLAEKEYYQLSTDQGKAEIIRLMRELKRLFLASELKRVESVLAEAEKDGQANDLKNILEEFKFLTEELRDVTL